MRTFIGAFGAAILLASSLAGSASAESSFGRGTRFDDNGRPAIRHHRICRDIYRRKVIWVHGHRKVVRVRVGRRCH